MKAQAIQSATMLKQYIEINQKVQYTFYFHGCSMAKLIKRTE